MSPRLLAGLALALGSAAALNWGFFAQHGAASALPPLSVRRPVRSLVALFSTPRWLIGFVTGIGGWALYVAALALAPLSLVQAASAGGIGLLGLLVWRSGTRPAKREVVGVALAVCGLILLALSLIGSHVGQSRGSPAAVIAWLAGSALAAAVFVAVKPRFLALGAGLGLSAGILYAAGDVATKAAVAGGAAIAFAAAVLSFHGVAFVSLQLGFQRGGALATAGVATLFMNALPMAAGTTIFHEGVPAGLEGGARVLAFATVVLGAAALARADTGTTTDAHSDVHAVGLVGVDKEMEPNASNGVRRRPDRVLG
jgi:hypothetical protein